MLDGQLHDAAAANDAAAVLSPLIACNNANAGNGVVKIGILNDREGGCAAGQHFIRELVRTGSRS